MAKIGGNGKGYCTIKKQKYAKFEQWQTPTDGIFLNSKHKAMFAKGTSGNPNGRPIGAVNLATKEIREAVTSIVNNNLLQLRADIEAMDPVTRAKVILALMEFVLPKVQRVQVETSHEETFNGKKPSWFDDNWITGMEIN